MQNHRQVKSLTILLSIYFQQLIFILLPLITILLALSACTTLSRPVDAIRMAITHPSQRYEQEGDRLTAEGRTSEALMAYVLAVKIDPKNVSALLKLSNGYANEGRRRLAVRYLLQAQALKPQDADIQKAITSFVPATNATAPLHQVRLVRAGEDVPTGLASAGGNLYIAFENGSITAFNLDGAALWQVDLPTPVTSAPVAAGGVLLVGGAGWRGLCSFHDRWIHSLARLHPCPNLRYPVHYG
jgi:tetratricopeptide (TPR) repeat protein